MSFEFSQNPQAIWLYQYDADGVYIGSVFMTIPAGTGLPANTTHIPCEPGEGQTGIFKNGVWEYVDDIRGTRFWNIHGAGFVISSLSESLPEWAITIEPPVAAAGYVLLFADGQWAQIEDKTGQLYYESDGTKHTVSDAWFTLPEGYTFVAPPEDKATFVTRWNGTEWVYVKDLRGQVIWNTTTREPLTITEIGPFPDGYTLKMPGQFDEWDGSAWVKNAEAERAYLIAQADRMKANLLSDASEQISLLSYAVSSGQATDAEKTLLTMWEQYRLDVNRVDTSAASVVWPDKP
ncbi:tail fiber assembly protein [Klebsiella pneumoniae]|uniref:tail fiber assembly protein n=1 Tax=Klebsiella pneumoniae TaxID=573 RepID=UPI000668642A|nr:tail fiber assembly protein [Klebsiella pneumoniae]RFC05618.1 tail fiber assembly protein [Klebsiella pneumoniae]HBS7486954.1 tail fiber assembly protein [Klebsiella pneumoniae]HBV3749662.1 tail fiber assembly protein [Klebsiella pneumoniae]HCJ1527673.1 tail fiber assembly protein [Klebsiella pneumoniae]HCJ1671313.1 tail fiber assembly protein [Klebsiella pneumoniae]